MLVPQALDRARLRVAGLAGNALARRGHYQGFWLRAQCRQAFDLSFAAHASC